jgi:predicted transcriptional regulator
MTSEIVTGFVRANPLPATQLPEVIRTVAAAMANPQDGGPPQAETPKPAVPIRKSVTPDYIVCLEDGKQLKTRSGSADPH